MLTRHPTDGIWQEATVATVSKLVCTGSRKTLANRCLSVLCCGRITNSFLIATSSAGTS